MNTRRLKKGIRLSQQLKSEMVAGTIDKALATDTEQMALRKQDMKLRIVEALETAFGVDLAGATSGAFPAMKQFTLNSESGDLFFTFDESQSVPFSFYRDQQWVFERDLSALHDDFDKLSFDYNTLERARETKKFQLFKAVADITSMGELSERYPFLLQALDDSYFEQDAQTFTSLDEVLAA